MLELEKYLQNIKNAKSNPNLNRSDLQEKHLVALEELKRRTALVPDNIF